MAGNQQADLLQQDSESSVAYFLLFVSSIYKMKAVERIKQKEGGS